MSKINEYRVAVPKTEITGYSQDPNQHMSNAGNIDLNKPMTASNAVGIGLAVVQGKKVAKATYNAVVDQIGDGRLEVITIIGQKGLTYIGVGLVTGGTGIAIMAAGEAITYGLNTALEGHKISMENEIKIAERGTRASYGVNYYD